MWILSFVVLCSVNTGASSATTNVIQALDDPVNFHCCHSSANIFVDLLTSVNMLAHL